MSTTRYPIETATAFDDQVDFEQAMGTLKGWERDRRIAQLAAVHGALEVGEDRTRGIGR